MSSELFAQRNVKMDQQKEFKKTYEQYIDH